MPKEVWRERKSGYLYQPRTLTPARTNQGVRSRPRYRYSRSSRCGGLHPISGRLIDHAWLLRAVIEAALLHAGDSGESPEDPWFYYVGMSAALAFVLAFRVYR
jgi:hypothetical protein